MDIDHVLQECRTELVLSKLGVTSQSALDVFKEQAKKWTTNIRILEGRSEAWRRLKTTDASKWEMHIPALLANESILREIDPATASESQKEDWSQILFTNHFSSLNFVPFTLMYVALSKIFLAPMIAWCMPFMTIILPFLALRYVYNMPVTWDAYWAAMRPMIFGNANNAGAPITVSTLLQWGSMILSYGHGMYIPYTNAVHCYKIDQLMLKGSKAVIDTITRLRQIADIWISYGIRKPWSLPDPAFYGDERQVLAWLTEDKQLLPQIYNAVGQVIITSAIQQDTSLVPVEWVQSPIPMCSVINGTDPLLSLEKRVPYMLSMGKDDHHAICTGPNRGGKSTFLRSVLTTLVFAHMWGVGFAEKCVLTPVEWVISSLRLEDRPGKESLFEREVSVAGEILKRARDQKSRGWIIIDELFHTTNPPDAATASQIFLQQLWNSDIVTSIISTHLFSHAISAPNTCQRLCVESSISSETGKIEYNYTVTKGINTMSSVNELLVESGVINNILNASPLDMKTSDTDIEDAK